MEDVACRMEDASASELASVQGRLADGVVSALACAKDPSALRAAGGHVVKVRVGHRYCWVSRHGILQHAPTCSLICAQVNRVFVPRSRVSKPKCLFVSDGFFLDTFFFVVRAATLFFCDLETPHVVDRPTGKYVLNVDFCRFMQMQ